MLLEKSAKYSVLTNRILLGILFLMSGIMKAFIIKPSGAAGFFAQLGIPAPLFFVWVVMLSEIIFGVALLAKYKLDLAVLPLIVIMIVAALTAYAPWKSAQNIGIFMMHLIIAADLWIVGSHYKGRM